MAYTALRFDVGGAQADAWSDALLQAGALAVEVTDARAGTPDEQAQFGEPGAAEIEAWAASRLVALFEREAEVERALGDAAATLGLALPPHDTYGIEEQDWVRATQSQFGPIYIGERLHVVPSWCVPPVTGVTLRIDPGLAFGTGSHPTTRLCLEWLLDEVARGESLLDYGCGSGVLAIAAAKLGAAPVFGTDVDAQALRASADNAKANGVDVAFVAPEALPARTFDVVVANILANPLMLLAPAIAARIAPGGRIALCGILEAQADAVREAYAQWFKLAPRRRADGWVLLAGRRDGSMPMADEKYTRCPACRTVFRVTPAQLALRQGQVRCGHCRTVFDGTTNLIQLAPVGAFDAPPEDDALGPLTVTLRNAHALEPVAAPASAALPQPSVAEASERVSRDEEEIDYDHRFAWDRPRKRSRRRTIGYAVAIVALALTLVLQLAWHYRDALAAHVPSTRPIMMRACALAKCTIGPLREIAGLSIDASDLQADPAHKGLLTLTATIRNRARYAVAYPHLELTLTDSQDRAVVRRALAPAEYAGGTATLGTGIPGNGELAVRLFLDASATTQSGYRVYLFYP